MSNGGQTSSAPPARPPIPPRATTTANNNTNNRGGGIGRRIGRGGARYRRALLASLLLLHLYSARRVARFLVTTNTGGGDEGAEGRGLRHFRGGNDYDGHVVPPMTVMTTTKMRTAAEEKRRQLRPPRQRGASGGIDTANGNITVTGTANGTVTVTVTGTTETETEDPPSRVIARPPPPTPEPPRRNGGSDVAAATAAGRDVPPSSPAPVAPEVRFFAARDKHDDDDDDVGGREPPCRLDPSHGLRYVGCGMDGHAYEARLDCGGGVDDDDRQRQQPRRRPKRSGGRGRDDHGRRVVVKVLTMKIDPASEGPGPRRFASERFDKVMRDGGGGGRNAAELYRHMVGPPTTAVGGNANITGGGGNGTIEGRVPAPARVGPDMLDVERHFALPLGAVDVPVGLLHDALDDALSEGSKYMCRYDVLRPDANATRSGDGDEKIRVVTAKVMPLSGGRAINPRALSNNSRLDIVRDIVAMHHHMFLRGVLHCDITFSHYHYHHTKKRLHPPSDRKGENSTAYANATVNTATVTLIDFERHRYHIPNPNPKKAWQNERYRMILHRQLWQVLSVIGTVCDPDRSDEIEIPNNVCIRERWDQPIPGDVLTHLVPAFDKCGFDREMVWREELYSGGGTTMTNDTARMYDALATWSGKGGGVG